MSATEKDDMADSMETGPTSITEIEPTESGTCLHYSPLSDIVVIAT